MLMQYCSNDKRNLRSSVYKVVSQISGNDDHQRLSDAVSKCAQRPRKHQQSVELVGETKLKIDFKFK